MLNHRARSPACRPLRRSEEHRGRLRRDTWICVLVCCTILCEKSPITLLGHNHGGLRNRLRSACPFWISGIPTQINVHVPEYAANKNLSAIASCSPLGRGGRAARAAQPPCAGLWLAWGWMERHRCRRFLTDRLLQATQSIPAYH